jgi:NAD(P)-dependent dehydrogenase (short-subunit alcohol dehydrogenase family)
VTGGATGIGRAVVLGLAEEGVRVFFTTRREEAGRLLQRHLESRGLDVFPIIIDVTTNEGPVVAFSQLDSAGFQPDILVNNVGDTLGIVDPECGVEEWRSLYRLNLETHVELVNLVLPHMKAMRWGRIVNITAGAALENSGPVPYSSMKAAYTAYTRSMARVLAPSGIVMSAVLPGVVLTEDGHWSTVLDERPEHASRYLEERTTLKRFGRPDEISPFVVLLASELASFAVGSIVPVEGGQARHFFAGNLESYA